MTAVFRSSLMTDRDGNESNQSRIAVWAPTIALTVLAEFVFTPAKLAETSRPGVNKEARAVKS